jgi:hypothetical protein
MINAGKWIWSNIDTVTCGDCNGEIDTFDTEFVLEKYKFCPFCGLPKNSQQYAKITNEVGETK